MRAVWPPPAAEITLAGVMHALSDPARLRRDDLDARFPGLPDSVLAAIDA